MHTHTHTHTRHAHTYDMHRHTTFTHIRHVHTVFADIEARDKLSEAKELAAKAREWHINAQQNQTVRSAASCVSRVAWRSSADGGRHFSKVGSGYIAYVKR